MRIHNSLLYSTCLLLTLLIGCGQSTADLAWPEITSQTKPWTRWWWHGSSVNEQDLTAAMEAYQKNGIGGLEITPVYGVMGEEDQFIDYLSPMWMEMLDHTLREGKRLDLGIDMATGTGWPFGGPHVTAEDAPKNVVHKTYKLQGGESLNEDVSYRQQPLVRAVRKQIDISELVEPVSANKNLQALALDQIKFEKQLPLQVLMAYSEAGETLSLTERVDQNGKLNWIAPKGNWTLYAVFQGWHGKMVERAAPGGEGNTIDHFSDQAITQYLKKFDDALSGHDISSLRAFFNDSYEVDDASGQSDWTPALFDEFKQRRGYDLREHLPALFGEDSEDKNRRVLCDYRETISDLILEKFTNEWRMWAHGKGAIVRNQAHGSPGNVLDLYAVSDIPETEGTNILTIKYASSASNVAGKKLTSSESATWLNEHFKSNLADVKKNVERFWLGGVNHIVYHGTAYSPPDEEWPGRLFYAAVHFNPQNPFWNDMSALNNYVARVQSFLQSGQPDNDILLYFPVHDRFCERGPEMLEHFGGGRGGFSTSAFKANAEMLQNRGYAYDYISDRQLQNFTTSNHNLPTGGVLHKTIVVPQCRYMPLATLEKLVKLAQDGATVIVHKSLPGDVPGLNELQSRQKKFQQLLGQIALPNSAQGGTREAKVGSGLFLLGDDLEELLNHSGVTRESMVDRELQFIRRSFGRGHYYFVANWDSASIDDWVQIAVNAKSVAIFDPILERSGMAKTQSAEDGSIQVYLQLAPGESCILKTFDSRASGPAYDYFKPVGEPEEISGTWKVSFVAGGPDKPEDKEITTLSSWTEWEGDALKRFSGTAKYAIAFSKPAGEGRGWYLDLGRVAESAKVSLNGKDVARLIGPTFRVFLDSSLFKESNLLEIYVSNLMANRIIDLEKRQVFWKKFYNINFPASRRENLGPDNLFSAVNWEPLHSGLLGPVTLTPVATF
jgi:hypothetical protein